MRSVLTHVLLLWVVIASAADYQPFQEKGKMGIKDSKGTVIIPPQFDALGWSDGSFSVVGDVTGYRQNNLWGIINLKKVTVAKPEFESLVYASGDFLIARKKIDAVHLMSGGINLSGEIKIPFVYDGILVQGLRAIVFNLKKSHYEYGLIDLANRPVIPMKYKNIWPLGTLRYAVENTQNKIALFSEAGNAITDFSIDSISPYYKNYAKVYQSSLQGLIDREGTLKLEIKYAAISILPNGKIKARLPSQWFYVNEKNEEQQKILADELKLNRKNLLIKRGRFWGLLDHNQNEIISPQYEGLEEFSTDSFIATKNGKCGLITADKIIIPFLYDSVKTCANKLKLFTRGIGWQLADEQGKIISERYYQQLLPAGENLFCAQSRNYWGVLNASGREMIHCVLDSLFSHRGEVWLVKFKNKYGLINTNEDWLVPPQDFPLQLINSTCYLEKQPTNFLIKLISGEIIYFSPNPLIFENNFFRETLPNGSEKTISYSGQIVNQLDVSDSAIRYFSESEGFRGFMKDGHYGFIDQKGKLRIANRYDSIGEFHEGLAAMKLIGKWGFVDRDDHIAINPNYDEPSNFIEGRAIVSRNKKKGMIDTNGKVVLPFRYNRITRKPNNHFLLESDNKLGLANSTGAVLIEPRFDILKEAGKGTQIACADKKCGTVSDEGLNLIPMMYEQIIYNIETKLFLAEKKSEWEEMQLQ
ncbi:MAG: hypothetical protein OJF59_000977 [Cytophagales bacterium]|jgi:hypothetical protein|nr:WG repeat-containing protein [Bacteroidota bacterium]MBS1980026.1 WG repeat-containing protein [Bacteroidota bacterium]WHZ07224.1 MAG: hypothetical protein OJF59_000977 [Cytophagales bacterium]